MKLAIVVPKLSDLETNLQKIHLAVDEAAKNHADLILFPETVITGFVAEDDYTYDINLALSVESPIIQAIRQQAKEKQVWICFGFLEKAEGILHDSALLINADGEIVLHYKRIDPHWHLTKDAHYVEGTEIKTAETPWGKATLILCGDIFNDEVVEKVKAAQADFLLFPLARSFESEEEYQDLKNLWQEELQTSYSEQVKKLALPTFLANYIMEDDRSLAAIDKGKPYFGGAVVFDKNGQILQQLPVFREDILYYKI